MLNSKKRRNLFFKSSGYLKSIIYSIQSMKNLCKVDVMWFRGLTIVKVTTDLTVLIITHFVVLKMFWSILIDIRCFLSPSKWLTTSSFDFDSLIFTRCLLRLSVFVRWSIRNRWYSTKTKRKKKKKKKREKRNNVVVFVDHEFRAYCSSNKQRSNTYVYKVLSRFHSVWKNFN